MKSTLILAFAALVLATACKKEDTPAAPEAPLQLSGTMSGAQEAPTPNASTSTGSISGTYTKSTKTFSFSVAYAGFTPILGHFHLGAPGVAGPVTLTYPYLNVSPIAASVVLTQAQEDALLAPGGGLYANLHSTAFPGGEIRGNVIVK